MENLARAGGVQENETYGVSCASDSWRARNGRSYPGPVRAKTKTSPFAVAHMEFGHGMIAVVTDGRKQAVTGIGGLVSRCEAGDRRGHVEAGRAGPVGRVALDTCQALYDEVSRERRDAGMSIMLERQALVTYQRPLTWSSELFAFNMASSISLSPSPLALYASRISRRVGGGG